MLHLAADGHYVRNEEVFHPAEIKTYIFDLEADLPSRIVILDEVLLCVGPIYGVL